MFVDIFMKLSKIGFSMECFAAVYLYFFYWKASKFGFCEASWVLAIKSKHFTDFLDIF